MRKLILVPRKEKPYYLGQEVEEEEDKEEEEDEEEEEYKEEEEDEEEEEYGEEEEYEEEVRTKRVLCFVNLIYYISSSNYT